jgi:hypothetical protein
MTNATCDLCEREIGEDEPEFVVESRPDGDVPCAEGVACEECYTQLEVNRQ